MSVTANPVEWWVEFSPEQAIDSGINPVVARTMGVIAAYRGSNPDEPSALVTEKPFLGGSTTVGIENEGDTYKRLVDASLGDLAVKPIVAQVLRPFEGASQAFVDTELKRASDIVDFSARLESEPNVPVVFIEGGLNGVLFYLEAGRSNGEPMQMPRVIPPYWREESIGLPQIQVPVEGHYAKGLMHAGGWRGAEWKWDEGPMKAFTDDTRFIHNPAQVVRDTDATNAKTMARHHQQWFVGEDTVQELANLWAERGEDPRGDNYYGEKTRLVTIASHPLTLLRAVTHAIDLDIADAPEVAARFKDWLYVAKQWDKGKPERVELSPKELESFRRFDSIGTSVSPGLVSAIRTCLDPDHYRVI